VLAVGDVVGSPGVRALEMGLNEWSEAKPDLLIVNGENLSGGSGVSRKAFQKLTGKLGVHVITTGNHWNRNRQIYDLLDSNKIALPGNAWNVDDFRQGFVTGQTQHGVPYAVCNMMGKAFMYGDNLDIHAEASSEKQAIANYPAGKWSLVFGTHTHVPTADDRILGSGTGYLTDVGMTGSYDSVIGMEKQSAIQMLRGQKPPNKRKLGENQLWANAVLTDIDAETGKCINIQRLQCRF